MDAFHEQDLEENIYKSNSFKARSEDYRPSLIRRLLSSGFKHKNHPRSPLSKENSTAQGFTNPAFEQNNEKNNSSARYPTSTNTTSSLNNAVKVSTPHVKTSSVSFRPNSLSLNRRKTYHLRDAEKAFYSSPSSPVDKPQDFNPVARTISAPLFKNNERMPSQQDTGGDDCLEVDVVEHRMDNLMPPIPEEMSRNASIASIEAGALKNPLKRLEDVHSLVQEANKVLMELQKSVSTDGIGKEPDGKGYESCCSKDDISSDEDDVDLTGVGNQGHIETSIVIDIDIDKENEHAVEISGIVPELVAQNNGRVESQSIEPSMSNTIEGINLDIQGNEKSDSCQFENTKVDDDSGTNYPVLFVPETHNSNNEDLEGSGNLDSTDENVLISEIHGETIEASPNSTNKNP